MEDINTHVKRLAEFLRCPFDKEEEVDEVVRSYVAALTFSATMK